MNSNNVSCLSAKRDNLPLVVSPCTRGSACAAGVPAQFIIHMLPLSADGDLDGMDNGTKSSGAKKRKGKLKKKNERNEV